MASSLSIPLIPPSQRAVVSIGADKEPIVQQMPTPSFDPNGDLILIHIKASSINPVDYKEWSTNFMNHPLPFILGVDFSGEIVAVGKNAVGGWKVGDEVFSLTNVSVAINGTHCDYCLIDGKRLARKPQNISHIQAATLTVALGTAYDGIANLAELSSKKTILISGATGGVGHFAVQLAKVLFGATVIGFASKPEGVELLKSLSVDHIIDYKMDDVQKKVFEITDGKGVDVVFDTTAGPAYALTASLVREGGKFIGVDATSPSKDVPFWKILEDRKVTDITFADLFKVAVIPEFEHLRIKTIAAPLSLAAQLIDNHQIEVHISTVVRLDDVPKILVDMKNGKTFTGKVAVRHD